MFVSTRSICPDCRMKIDWYDNIPLISFVLLKRTCRHCGQKISWQYFLVEFCLGGLFLLAALFHSQNWFLPSLTLALVQDLIILSFLVFIFLYDFKYMEILPSTTIMPAMVLLFVSLSLNWQSVISLLLGAGFGFGVFSILYAISKGRWIGGGDALLGFFMGVILGWPLILVAFFISYVVGAGVSLVLIDFGQKTRKSRIPFGTFLVLGTIITMFWGENILEWYLLLLHF